MAKKRRTRRDEELIDLWLAYQVERTDELRNELTMCYMHLADAAARQHWFKLGRFLSLDELVSAGAEGLMKAVAAFDLSRGIRFETYAPLRIHGAIRDYMREQDHVPRLVRKHYRLAEEAAENISQALGTPATEEQIVRATRLSHEQLRYARNVSQKQSIDDVLYEGETREQRIAQTLEDDGHERRIHRAEKREAVQRLLRGLSERERLIVLLYYLDGWTMKEIGETLDLSESRVSQMHSEIIVKMRQRVADHEEVGDLVA